MPPSSLTDWRWRLPLSLYPADLSLWPQPTEAVTVQPQNNLADLTALLLVRHTGGPGKQTKMYVYNTAKHVEFSWKFRRLKIYFLMAEKGKIYSLLTTHLRGIPDVSLTW